MKCPCDSNREFNKCCEPFLKAEAWPDTAEELMRSRYTAHVLADIPYIKKTLAPESQKDFDAEGTRKWAAESKWHGLKIHSTEAGGTSDKKAFVEFTAIYEQDGERVEHHERSRFRRNDAGHWLFVDAETPDFAKETIVPITREAPKVGRNDPCPCGSGKKFKKCCEA